MQMSFSAFYDAIERGTKDASGTYVKKVIFPDVVKLFTAELGKLD